MMSKPQSMDDLLAIQQLQAQANDGPSATLQVQDEDQIGEPFYKFQQLKRSNPAAAVQSFAHFKVALMRRMDAEEAELFPAFETRVGKHAGNISEAMRVEHQQIKNILNSIEAKLSSADLKTEAEERALEAALIAHNHRETRVLYFALE
jgi:iron-sulfur cluster repair protein YtfE (RIC family)